MLTNVSKGEREEGTQRKPCLPQIKIWCNKKEMRREVHPIQFYIYKRFLLRFQSSPCAPRVVCCFVSMKLLLLLL